MDTAEPNDSMETAAVLDGSAELSLGFATNRDHDYYRFTVEEPTYLMIKASGSKESQAALKRISPAVEIYNEKGERLNRGGVPRLRWFDSGTYYICFYGGDPFYSESYQIDVDFLEDVDKTEPNDTPDRATPIVAGKSTPVRYTSGDVDYYAVRSKEPGYVIVSHPRKLGPFAGLAEVNENGEIVNKQEGKRAYFAIKVEDEKIIRLTTTEEYRPLDSYDPVMLNTSFLPLNADPQEPNDTIQMARPVPVNQAFEALMIPSFDIDHYRFTVGRAGEVKMGLAAESIDLDLSGRLYLSNGKTADSKWHDLPWTATLKPGSYILAVKQWNGIKTFPLKPYRFLIETPDKKGESVAKDRFASKSADANRGVALAMKAYAHYCRKEYTTALPLYEEASELIPDCAAVWNDMGACCVCLDDLEAAKSYLEKAIEKKKDYGLALRNRGVVARKEGDVQGYLAWTEKAVKAVPDAINLRFHGHALFMLATKETDRVRQRHILEKALAQYEQSWKLNPKDAYTKRDLLRIRKALGKTSK